MLDRLALIESTYEKLQQKLIDEISDVNEMTKTLKELSQLQETVETYRLFKHTSEELSSLNELLELETDETLIEMATLEINEHEEKLEKLKEKLRFLLLPKDPNDDKNIIMEIKGAAGGDEGNIFAGDLFRMYHRYADSMGWKVEVLNANEGTMGGFTSIEFMISGDKVYSFLKHEAGVHRVQRVPETESQGRIHTSTATVLVMPEADEVEFDVDWNDIKVDTYNSSGPGGQSVNTTKSAVRLTHLPTNTVVTCQDGKSQHDNKDKAFIILKARLYANLLEEQALKDEKIRKSLIGTGDRSEKIRTYNYPQNRVSDHRIQLTIQRLDAIMEGRLELILEPLINEYQKQLLLNEQ
ncbi:MAG: peptide chain release factor 1 [Acholeplasmataceae bacterium]|jgi:peptide chain release factor 1